MNLQLDRINEYLFIVANIISKHIKKQTQQTFVSNGKLSAWVLFNYICHNNKKKTTIVTFTK